VLLLLQIRNISIFFFQLKAISYWKVVEVLNELNVPF
jgi:pyruvate/2-oxoglutarate/acetoin dehydrogenase E1 component